MRRIAYSLIFWCALIGMAWGVNDSIVYDVGGGFGDCATGECKAQDSVDLCWISELNPTILLGGDNDFRLGMSATNGRERTLLRILCENLIADTSKLDSVIMEFDIFNARGTGLFATGDTSHLQFHRLTGNDKGWVESQATWNKWSTDSSWNVAGVGLGNDADADPDTAGITTGDSTFTQIVYNNETSHKMIDQQGATTWQFLNSYGTIQIPLQGIKESIMGDEVSWVITEDRFSDYNSDDLHGHDSHSDDKLTGQGSLFRVIFHFQSGDVDAPTRRRRIEAMR